MITSLSIIFSLIVSIPVIAVVYLLITKKISFKSVLLGVLAYFTTAATARILIFLITLLSGGMISENFIAAVTTASVITPLSLQFSIWYFYSKIIRKDIAVCDSLGIGLGTAVFWLLATVGTTLFFSIAMGLVFSGEESELAAMTPETVESYNIAKEEFMSRSVSDYILLAVTGFSLVIGTLANFVMNFEYTQTREKKTLLGALLIEIAVYLPFVLAHEAGIVNMYLSGFSIIVASVSIWLILEVLGKYNFLEPPADHLPSPLEGRNFSK